MPVQFLVNMTNAVFCVLVDRDRRLRHSCIHAESGLDAVAVGSVLRILFFQRA